MLNFRLWFEETDTSKIKFQDVMNSFFGPDEKIWISASLLIDGKLSNFTIPFIYLEEGDELFVGHRNKYHHDMIENEPDTQIRYKMKNMWRGQLLENPPSGVVGRIGYRTYGPRALRGLSNKNISKLFFGDEEVSDKTIEQIKFGDDALPLQKFFDEIDICAFYKFDNYKIENAAKCIKKLQEQNLFRDLDKTVFIFATKAYKYEDIIVHANTVQEKPKPVTRPDDGRKGYAAGFSKDYKPTDWKTAFRLMDKYPVIGDSIINSFGRKYHG